jgi:UDP-N-acetylglucosamine acyltransferase
MAIHATAVIHPEARVHETAEIGPYCVIGSEVTIGARTRLLAHVYIEGPITIGEENVFQPYSAIGSSPQDLKYHGERTETCIGNRNLVREFVTVHRGTEGGGGLTSIGDDNLLQAYAHVAHDCHVRSHCILAHGATLGGHVTVEDWAVVGAHSGVHQFCVIGKHAYVGGYSVITQSVMPFSLVVTERGAKTFGVNKTGLDRRGFTKETIQNLHKSFRLLTKAGLNTDQALERIAAEISGDESVAELVAFIQAAERGIVK